MTNAQSDSPKFQVDDLETRLIKAQVFYDRKHHVTETLDQFMLVADGEVTAEVRAELDRIRHRLDSEELRAKQNLRSIEALVSASSDVVKIACMPAGPEATFSTILGARLILALADVSTDYDNAEVILETLRRIIRDPSTPEIRVRYARELHDEPGGVFRYALSEARRLRKPASRAMKKSMRIQSRRKVV